MAKFKELTDQTFKDNIIALVESLHKNYLSNSYQVAINNNNYSIGGKSYSNTIIYAACQTYTECQNDFINGEWNKIQSRFKELLNSKDEFYGLEYDEKNLKPYLNMRIIYYNALYNTIAYNVMTDETITISNFISKEEIKNSVCWLLTYGEYINYNLEQRKTTLINKLYEKIKGVYEGWRTDSEINGFTSEHASKNAQQRWQLALEDFRGQKDLGLAIPPSDNSTGEIFGYSHIASVIWWLKNTLKDTYRIDDNYFNDYPFWGLVKKSILSGEDINIMENYKTYETNDGYGLITSPEGLLGQFWINDYWTYHVSYKGDKDHGINYQIWNNRALEWKNAFRNLPTYNESRNMLLNIINTITKTNGWFKNQVMRELYNMLNFYNYYNNSAWNNFQEDGKWTSISFENNENWTWMHKYITWAAIMFLRLKVYYEIEIHKNVVAISTAATKSYDTILSNCNEKWLKFLRSFLSSFLIEGYYRVSGNTFDPINLKLVDGEDETGNYWIDIFKQSGVEGFKKYKDGTGPIVTPDEEMSWNFKNILIDYYSQETGANDGKSWNEFNPENWPNYSDNDLSKTWDHIQENVIYKKDNYAFSASIGDALWTTTIHCPGRLDEPLEDESIETEEKGMFGFSMENIKFALMNVFSPNGVPLILNIEYVQQIASDPNHKFLYSYQLLEEQQCNYYNDFWKNSVKNYINSSSVYKNVNSNIFPALYKENQDGDIIFDTNHKFTYTFIDLNSLTVTKNNLNNTDWELSLKSENDSSGENPEPPITEEEIIIPSIPETSIPNEDEVVVSGPTLIITKVDKSADGSKINGITFELKGLSSDYTRGDRRVWLSMEDGEGNWIGDQRNYNLPLEEDNGVYHIPDGETIVTDVNGRELKWNFETSIPYNDTKYKIYCKMAWSPATLRQEYMLNNEIKKEWEWLIDNKAYDTSLANSIKPIFTLEEIQNINFKTGQPIKKYKDYFYSSYGYVAQFIYQKLSDKTPENFSNAMKDFCRSTDNVEIRELLKYMPLPSFENIYNRISNIFSLISYLQNYYSQKLREDPREKQIYTVIGNFKEIEENIQLPSSGESSITPPTVDYTDWLNPEVTVTSVGSTQYKALFPPILESSQPAFNAYSTYEYEIFFKLSNYTNFNEVGHVDFRIVFQSDNSSAVNSSYWIDEIIYVPHKHIQVNSNGTYSVKIPVNFIKHQAWETNTYYKIQARLGTDFGMWETSINSLDNNIQTTNTDIQNYRTWRDQQIKNGWFSEWSTVMVIKPINPPIVRILNGGREKTNYSFNTMAFKPVEFTDQPQIFGQFKSESSTQQELLDYYCFDLYVIDEEGLGQLVETSGWNKYDGSLNILNKNGLDEEKLINELGYNISESTKKELSSSVVILWQPKNKLEQNKQYYVYFTIQTQNKYIANAMYGFQIAYSTLNYFGKMQDEKLIAIPNEEEGLIELQFYSGYYTQNQVVYNATIGGNFVLTRCKVGENIWEDIQHFSVPELQKAYDYETLCYDLTVESGIEYKYGIQREYQGGIRSNRLESNSALVNFEHSYLVGENKQLKIKFDPKISSFKHTVLASKQDTLGGKYPLILKNGSAYYAEFPIEGLITLHTDENAMFITRKNNNIYYNDEQIIPGNKFRQESGGNSKILRNNRGERAELLGQDDIDNIYYFDTNLTDNNIFIERKFREKVEEFLNNSCPKLFKSATEGNIIVNLMNVSLTPKQELGRAIYSFSATAYEIAENNNDNLSKYKIIDFSEFNPALQKGYTMGQISGYFNATTDIIKLIKEDIINRSTAEVQFEPKTIQQLRFEHYPKFDLTNELEEINYKIIKEVTNSSSLNSQRITELKQQRNTLIELQNYLNLKDGYPPCQLKIGTNMITLLGDKPYQIDDLNWEFGTKTVQIIPYNYNQNGNIGNIPVPMIITYVASIDYTEPVEIHASQGDYYKSLDSISGYFVNPNSSLSNMFIYDFQNFLNNYGEIEVKIPQKEISKIYFNDTYYNNYDIMQIIINKIEQNFEKKAKNTELIKIKELNGVQLEKPMWYFLDKYNSTTYYYLLEFTNIQELIIEAEPGTTLYLNKDDKQNGQKITIGPNGLYQLSPLEINMINTNKTLLIDESISPDITYLNLRFTYELNVIQTVSKYLGIK